MKNNDENKVIYRSFCVKSFFTHYLLGCFVALICVYAFQYFGLGEKIIVEKLIMTLGLTTVIVCVVAPVILLRRIEITDERMIIRWGLINRKKCIPFCLVERVEKGNFLASPAVKVFFKSGRMEKIAFVDRSDDLMKALPVAVAKKKIIKSAA